MPIKFNERSNLSELFKGGQHINIRPIAFHLSTLYTRGFPVLGFQVTTPHGNTLQSIVTFPYHSHPHIPRNKHSRPSLSNTINDLDIHIGHARSNICRSNNGIHNPIQHIPSILSLPSFYGISISFPNPLVCK